MDYIVKKSIAIKASPFQVWNALTNPEKTKQYFFHCEVFSDWKAGSPITFKGKILWVWPIEMRGKILEIEPQQLLKYSLQNKKGGQSVVTDRLTYANGITTVHIEDNVGSEPGAEERFAKSQKGWDKVLKGLKKVVESGF